MKLIALTLFKWKEDGSVELMNCYELGFLSFFQRPTVKEHIKFHSRLVVNRTKIGQRASTEFDQNLGKCHSWVHPEGLAAAVLVDSEYPMRVAFTLLNEVVRMFLEQKQGKWEDVAADQALSVPDIEAMFNKFQNPAEADKLTKIEKDLEEVKGVVMQSMDDLLKRGESLDKLMEKSKDLSNTSVQFYRTAKKNNQCCKMY
jgi:synaptobrevin family protein YKT6